MFYERNPYFENNAFLKFLINTGTTFTIIICLSTLFSFYFIYKSIKKIYKNKQLTDKKDLIIFTISIISTLLFVTAPLYYLYENTIDKPIKPNEYSNYLKITDQKIESKDTSKIIVFHEGNFLSSYTSYNLNDCEITLQYDVYRQKGYLNIVEKNKKINDKIKNHEEIYLNDKTYEQLKTLQNE